MTFDRLFFDLLGQAPTNSNYPPYNVLKADDTDEFFIELAVAGFAKSDLKVQLEDRILTISGDTGPDDDEGVSYLHKGIGARRFSRTFTLAPDVKITGTKYFNGILTVFLEKEIPAEKRPITFEIT